MGDSGERSVVLHGRSWLVEENAWSEPTRRELHFWLADDASALAVVGVAMAPLNELSSDDLLRLLQASLRQETTLLAAFGERWEVRLNGQEVEANGALLLGVGFRCVRNGRTVHGYIAEHCHTPARTSTEDLRRSLGSALPARGRRA